MNKLSQPIFKSSKKYDILKIGENMELLIMCLTIFFARICDVSLGTIRVIMVGKGKSFAAFLIAFVEITIWFIVARDALTGADSIWIMLAYASGYACGTYLGSFISEKFVRGNLGVQVVTTDHDKKVIKAVRDEGYAVSVIDIKGKEEEGKYMMFIEIDKKRFDHLRDLIKKLDPKAFIVVNETKYVQNGYIK